MSIRTTRQLASALGLGVPEDPIDVSVVLPAYNEAGSIEGSFNEISAVLDAAGLDYEMLFVDDGSSDGTWKAIKALRNRTDRVRGLRHRSNSGKAATLANGFAHARGDIIVALDADLQYDPNDVVRAIDKIGEGYDAVIGAKVVRKDLLSKRIASKFFNFFVSATTGVKLRDMNSGLKAYTRDAAQELIGYGYGELHRFFVVILVKKGYCVTEILVEGRPRISGSSKYGMERYLRGAFDYLTVIFLSGYLERPLHLFGGLGLLSLGAGMVAIVALTIADVLYKQSLLETPLLLLSVLVVVAGLQFFVVGLIAEMINYLDRTSASRAAVSEVIGVDRRTNTTPEADRAVERRRSRSLARPTAPAASIGFSAETVAGNSEGELELAGETEEV